MRYQQKYCFWDYRGLLRAQAGFFPEISLRLDDSRLAEFLARQVLGAGLNTMLY
jgi:hypothetical protein